ncbi:hypothetical protein VEE68_52750 (plasmid) [Escherichia coli]|nr:hypothetical protein VEE68_52750 [Escherichia coli]GFQ13678.1 hypothetical protein MH17539M_47820 [Enterobacter hormaechei]
MLFVKGQANVPGKDNVPDSSLLALIQNYSNRRRETFACAGVGNNYFSSRGNGRWHS